MEIGVAEPIGNLEIRTDLFEVQDIGAINHFCGWASEHSDEAYIKQNTYSLLSIFNSGLMGIYRRRIKKPEIEVVIGVSGSLFLRELLTGERPRHHARVVPARGGLRQAFQQDSSSDKHQTLQRQTFRHAPTTATSAGTCDIIVGLRRRRRRRRRLFFLQRSNHHSFLFLSRSRIQNGYFPPTRVLNYSSTDELNEWKTGDVFIAIYSDKRDVLLFVVYLKEKDVVSINGKYIVVSLLSIFFFFFV